MRVVIAPDKFKGSLSAPEVIDHLRRGLDRAALSAGTDLEVIGVPVADGGEGTLDAAISAGFELRTTSATGPTGVSVEATYAVRGDQAVIEMATASGLALLPDGTRDPLRATSRGTGDLIRAALDQGARRIVLAIGGSASTDGGAGMLAALGARLLDAGDQPIRGGGAALADLARVDLTDLDPRLAQTKITLASDVDNPLLGPGGAATVFGPQKGATDRDVSILDAALSTWVNRLGDTLGATARTAADQPGAGAAGGVGYAALAVLGADRRPGVELVISLTGLTDALAGADLVITGEGKLDEQSLLGKTPIGVARAASRAGVPAVAVCGTVALDMNSLADAGLRRVYPLTALASPDEAISRAGELLQEVALTVWSEQLAPDRQLLDSRSATGHARTTSYPHRAPS